MVGIAELQRKLAQKNAEIDALTAEKAQLLERCRALEEDNRRMQVELDRRYDEETLRLIVAGTE